MHDCVRALLHACMQVITSRYELEVTAKTGCCLSEVRLRAPILVNDPQPTAPQQPPLQPPQDWSPQVRAEPPFVSRTCQQTAATSLLALNGCVACVVQVYPAVQLQLPTPDGYQHHIVAAPAVYDHHHQKQQQHFGSHAPVVSVYQEPQIAAFPAGGAYDQPAQGAGWEVPGHVSGYGGRA